MANMERAVKERAVKKAPSEELACSLCFQPKTDPKVLQCNHSFCQKCLESLAVKDKQDQLSLTCPCQQVTSVPASGVAGLMDAASCLTLLDKKGSSYSAQLHQQDGLPLYLHKDSNILQGQNPLHENSSITQDQKLGHSLHQESITQGQNPLHQGSEIKDSVSSVSAQAYKDTKSSISSGAAENHKCCKNFMSTMVVGASSISVEAHEDSQSSVSTEAGGPHEDSHSSIDLPDTGYQTGSSVGPQGLSPPCLTLSSPNFSSLPEENSEKDVFAPSSPALPDPAQYYLDVKATRIEVTVGGKAHVLLTVVNYAGAPCSEERGLHIESELVSDILNTRTKCSIRRVELSKYEIDFTTSVKGMHSLFIKAEGEQVSGSPYSVLSRSDDLRIGRPMLTLGDIAGPWGVALTPSGDIVVTEWNGNCVSVLSPSGTLLQSFGSENQGKSDKCFENPRGVALDGHGNILVVNNGKERLQKFTADGKLVAAVGSSGSGPLQFTSLRSIAYNPSNQKIYVAEGSDRIQVLNSDLTYSSTFGKTGSGPGQFHEPWDITCDSMGKVYVADASNNRIQVFSPEGEFVREFGKQGPQKLCHPVSVAVDTKGLVYVNESDNCRVYIFSPEGRCLTSFGGREGSGVGQFRRSRGLAVDECGVIYVCDHGNNRIQIF